MSVTYYVALPFVDSPDGPAPGQAQECPSETVAVSTARGLARQSGHVGAVAFKRTGDPDVGEFSDALVSTKFGDVPDDLSGL